MRLEPAVFFDVFLGERQVQHSRDNDAPGFVQPPRQNRRHGQVRTAKEEDSNLHTVGHDLQFRRP